MALKTPGNPIAVNLLFSCAVDNGNPRSSRGGPHAMTSALPEDASEEETCLTGAWLHFFSPLRRLHPLFRDEWSAIPPRRNRDVRHAKGIVEE